jgi:hypothetical protein
LIGYRTKSILNPSFVKIIAIKSLPMKKPHNSETLISSSLIQHLSISLKEYPIELFYLKKMALDEETPKAVSIFAISSLSTEITAK